MACVFSWTLFVCQNSNIWLKIPHFLSLALSGLFKSPLQNSKLYIPVYRYHKLQIYINNKAGLKPKKASSVQNPWTNNDFGPENFCWPNPPKVCCFAWSVCSRSTSPASPPHAVVLRPLKMQQSVGWRRCNVTWQTNQPKIGWKSWRSWVCQVDDLFFGVWLFFFLDVNYNWK